MSAIGIAISNFTRTVVVSDPDAAVSILKNCKRLGETAWAKVFIDGRPHPKLVHKAALIQRRLRRVA